MDHIKEFTQVIGELYLQLRQATNKLAEMDRKIKDQQEEIALLKNGQPNKGNTPT